MKERPILFSAPMVRALLDGTKTQTRREFKAKGWDALRLRALEFVHVLHGSATNVLSCAQPTDAAWAGFKLSPDSTSPAYFKCPHGQPGDRLWVKETHSFVPDADEPAGCSGVLYAADGERYGKLRPSIHMPRWASRILLEIVSVRVERLRDIQEGDAIAEGIIPVPKIRPDDPYEHQFWRDYCLSGDGTFCKPTAVESYMSLWNSINGAGSWEANPWVWVIEFRRIEPAA